jgi:hypothetical protein
VFIYMYTHFMSHVWTIQDICKYLVSLPTWMPFEKESWRWCLAHLPVTLEFHLWNSESQIMFTMFLTVNPATILPSGDHKQYSLGFCTCWWTSHQTHCPFGCSIKLLLSSLVIYMIPVSKNWWKIVVHYCNMFHIK